MNNNKIIGYKCPMDLFGGIVKKGSLYINSHINKGYNIENNISHVTVLPSEIVEQWETVYEEIQYTVGEWLYIEPLNGYNECLFRFKNININGSYLTDENYIITKKIIYCDTDSLLCAKHIRKATNQEIEKILTKVAIDKGFIEGVKFQSTYNPLFSTTVFEITYKYSADDLVCNNVVLYNGKTRQWATIIPTKLQLPEGYVDNGNKTITRIFDNTTRHYEWYLGYYSLIANQADEFQLIYQEKLIDYIIENNK